MRITKKVQRRQFGTRFIPRSSVRWSPHSGHGSGLYWHPAVGCGNDVPTAPRACEWARDAVRVTPGNAKLAE